MAIDNECARRTNRNVHFSHTDYRLRFMVAHMLNNLHAFGMPIMKRMINGPQLLLYAKIRANNYPSSMLATHTARIYSQSNRTRPLSGYGWPPFGRFSLQRGGAVVIERYAKRI